MEILKFSEPPKRSRRSGSVKRSGLMPMVSFGIAVLVLGGMSTTLAGTITLNSSGTVEFGQGVVTTAACDTSISVTPISAYETSTGFYVNEVRLSNIGVSGGEADTTTASLAKGCLGKVFYVKAYNGTASIQFQDSNKANGTACLALKIPATIDSTTATSGNAQYFQKGSAISGVNNDCQQTYFTLATTGNFTSLTSTEGGDATGNGTIKITGIRLPATVEKITLESSS